MDQGYDKKTAVAVLGHPSAGWNPNGLVALLAAPIQALCEIVAQTCNYRLEGDFKIMNEILGGFKYYNPLSPKSGEPAGTDGRYTVAHFTKSPVQPSVAGQGSVSHVSMRSDLPLYDRSAFDPPGKQEFKYLFPFSGFSYDKYFAQPFLGPAEELLEKHRFHTQALHATAFWDNIVTRQCLDPLSAGTFDGDSSLPHEMPQQTWRCLKERIQLAEARDKRSTEQQGFRLPPQPTRAVKRQRPSDPSQPRIATVLPSRDDEKEAPGVHAPAGWFAKRDVREDTNWLPFVVVGGVCLALLAS